MMGYYLNIHFQGQRVKVMLYMEVIFVYSVIHSIHVSTLREYNVESLGVNFAVHIVATGLRKNNLRR